MSDLLCSACKGPREKASDYYCKKCRAAYQSRRARSLTQGTWTPHKVETVSIVGMETGFVSLTQNKGSGFHYAEAEKEELVEAAGNKCGICGSEEDLTIDHCHERYVYRGILCRNCNVGLGMFRDSVALLEGAIAYLKKTF
jgi:hypothetical protein